MSYFKAMYGHFQTIKAIYNNFKSFRGESIKNRKNVISGNLIFIWFSIWDSVPNLMFHHMQAHH